MKIFSATMLVVALLLVGTVAQADPITITQNATGNGDLNSIGQSFTPNVNDGYAGSPTPTTVDLTQFTMQSYASWGTYDDTPVYLSIYTGFSPEGTYGAGVGFVGSSTNSVVWPNTNYTNAVFSFDNLALNYATQYYALISTASGDGGALTGRVGLASLSSLYAGGDWIVISGGVPVEMSASDATFTATFQTVPEPSTLMLLGAGLVGLLAYAWRKRR